MSSWTAFSGYMQNFLMGVILATISCMLDGPYYKLIIHSLIRLVVGLLPGKSSG